MSHNTKDVFDGILVNIAKEVYPKSVVTKLGTELGFIPAEIFRFNEENKQEGGSYMGNLDMLRQWRQKQRMSEEREKLKVALKKADLSHLLDKYLSADDVEQQPSHEPPVSTVKGASSLPPREEGHEEVTVVPDGEGYYKQKMKQAKPSEQQLDLEQSYKMDAVTKGHMFILNMTKKRTGSEVDVKNITHVFKEIGYEIETHSDLTAEDLKGKLKNFVEEDEEDPPRHKGMCSAVFLLMAHGNEEGIVCADNEVVTTTFIRDTVSGMKYMNGKPKTIFYQCCRGDADGEMVEHDQAETDKVTTSKSDVFIVHATTYGNYAYRHKVLGSWFIQMLCEELLENAHDSDLSTMLEQVTKKIEKEASNKYGQTPVVIKQGISKKLYFLPKYPSAKTHSKD